MSEFQCIWLHNVDTCKTNTSTPLLTKETGIQFQSPGKCANTLHRPGMHAALLASCWHHVSIMLSCLGAPRYCVWHQVFTHACNTVHACIAVHASPFVHACRACLHRRAPCASGHSSFGGGYRSVFDLGDARRQMSYARPCKRTQRGECFR